MEVELIAELDFYLDSRHGNPISITVLNERDKKKTTHKPK